MADDAKNALALLNGLARRDYYGHKDITNEFLKQEIFPDMQDDEFNNLVLKFNQIMKSLVSADMDMTQLEAFLTAQMRKKEGALSEIYANVFRKFWKTHRTKIHESIIAQTTWGDTLQKVAWRIDLKSQARHVDEINTPVAIMELHVGNSQQKEKAEDVLRFEMDENRLASVLSSMREIEEQINNYIQK
ncbi:COMM domain-containing protein 1-like [Gigantopelta aegis]|uniref:COMM domain-containing protein 1-like n=1 Tax=Gigantopelta aegis TaxID=1735272 RepID=UPI001B8898B2|nr:COMM domain-containing protein 1-like [Gigantopelta aegis]